MDSGYGCREVDVALFRCDKKSLKAKLSVYWLMYLSALPYDHKVWVVTNRIRLWIQSGKGHPPIETG